MPKHLKAILNSYSEIFFLNGNLLGAALLGLTLLNPNVALAGLIAVLAAYGFANFIKMEKDFLASGFYTYNPLLVGLSIGYLFQITPLTIFFVVVAGVSTFLLTIVLHNLFAYYLRLPILSLPFVFVSAVAYVASSQYSNLFVAGQYPQFSAAWELHLPLWLSGLLKSAGAILFMPNVLAGAIVLLALLFSSRILFLLALAGYFTGTLITAALAGNMREAFTDLNGFNFILIAMALGGVFFVPSLKTYVLALLGVTVSTVILKAAEVFGATYGMPAFTLPFNLVVLTFIYVLGLINHPLVAYFVKETPEETLDHYLATQHRFPGTLRTLALPFAGKWTVWQGCNGKWTHQGSWRYAYDFVITDENGKTHRDEGLQLEDYYAFKKPVLSPVRGRVVKVLSSLPDNPIAQVDRANNWGNLVIVYDARGFYVELSHFVQNSVKVKEGDWVERGALLGLCGNSGYSPQPHIHVQVQPTEEIGAYTLPFSFTSYACEQQFYANHLPAENALVEPMYSDKSLDLKMSFILDQEYEYEVWREQRKVSAFTLLVKMAPDGTFYFDSGKGRLYFGKYEGTFYFYRVEGRDENLHALFLALPRLPLAFRAGMEWRDHVPVGTLVHGMKKAFALLLCSLHHGLDKIECRARYLDQDTIVGTVSSQLLRLQTRTRVELDEHLGIRCVEVGPITIRRKKHETSALAVLPVAEHDLGKRTNGKHRASQARPAAV